MASPHPGEYVGALLPLATQNPVGKKITGSDGAPVAVPVGRGIAATALDQGAEIGADRLGATAQSPSVLLAS